MNNNKMRRTKRGKWTQWS